MNKKRIVVFASGSGTNFINIYNKINEGKINAKIILLISNNKSSKAIEFAKNNNITSDIINIKKYGTEKEILKRYRNILNKYYPDLILLAGFMKKIPNEIIKNYKYKIFNVHPSLLPKFGGEGYYGIKVHRAVIESKEVITGATIHFVDDEYDTGPIVLQETISVLPSDTPETLSKRVLQLEYLIYYKAVKLFCNNQIKINKYKAEIE